MPYQPIRFYQTGTFTVGNRLLPAGQRSVQADMRRTNSLNSGHRACQGCGEALGARYAIDAAMEVTHRQLVAANANRLREIETGRSTRVGVNAFTESAPSLLVAEPLTLVQNWASEMER